MRLATRTITLVAAVGLLAACAPSGGGASGDAGDDAQSIGLSVADTDAGPSLVGPNGMTLYVFTQDTDGTSTCTDECAAAWPPLTVQAGAEVESGDGVTGELAIVDREDGDSQVTYDGMPLYYYSGDSEPGDATGEGVNDVWFIASPEGQEGGGAAPTDDGSAAPSPTPIDYDY
jgi:predicted lipoprotein with Yx(FWY)xxD motif